MQGIEGEDAARDIELADEAPGAEDFAAGAVGGDLPGDHAGAVGDDGEAHARVVGAARTVQRGGLAVDGQGALRGVAGGGEVANGPVQRVGVDAREDAVQAGP